MRWVLVFLLVGGCVGPQVDARDPRGQRLPVSVFQQPICVVLCFNTLQTTGSDIDQLGSGSATNTQTPTVTTTTGSKNR